MRFAGIFIAIAFAIIVGLVVLNSASLVGGYAYKDNMAQAASASLAALGAVALFVERGMAIINAILFGDAQRSVELQLIRDDPKALDNMSKVLSSKERVRALGSFVAGLFISAAGVRTLEGLLQTGAKNVPHNPFLFPVDVILTAALIAGGSNALAFLVQTAKDKLAVSQDVTVTPTAKQGGKDGQEAPEQPVRTHPLKYLRARLTTAG